MLRVVTDDESRAEMTASLDEICREGARRMLVAALKAEADIYVESLAGQLDDNGHRLVVRNGTAEVRTITSSVRPSDHRVRRDGAAVGVLAGARTRLRRRFRRRLYQLVHRRERDRGDVVAGFLAGVLPGEHGTGAGLVNGAATWGPLLIGFLSASAPSTLRAANGAAGTPFWTGFWWMLIGLRTAAIGAIVGGALGRAEENEQRAAPLARQRAVYGS